MIETAIIAVFFVVYLGMILGGLPFLQLDRTGVALLGAIALVSVGALTLEEAWAAIHAPTLILLFAFMVISAQLRLGGFYTWVTWRLGAAPLPPAGLLMTSRKLHSYKMLGLVDWQLLVLFIGLFVVNHGLARTGFPEHAMLDLADAGVDLQHPVPLFAAAFVLSNIVSNVPAVMLLLPAATHEIAGPVTAATLAVAAGWLWLRLGATPA